MSDIVQEMEELLARWEPGNATEIEQIIANRLLQHGCGFSAAASPAAERSGHVILAAGGIVWKSHSAERRLALIHRPRYDDWCLPKGKVDAGEMLSETARREVWEETGCDVEFTRPAGVIHYLVKAGPKFVFYWEMRATQVHPLAPTQEVDQVQWLTVSAALDRLTYDVERDFLERFQTRGG